MFYIWYRKQIEQKDAEIADLRADIEQAKQVLNNRSNAIQRRDDRIEELESQLQDAESQARQAEAKLFNANAKLDKQLEILTDVRGQLASEQHARHQAEKALSEQLSRAQSAIDTLQGKV